MSRNSNGASEVTITVQGADVAMIRNLVSHAVKVNCSHVGCSRRFLTLEQAADHAASVHTFDDIQQMVGEQIREQYAKPGNYKATPPVSSVYAWVRDIADDWVVFVVSGDKEEKLYKADYTIEDTKVTLGAPTEVVRRTVYDPVKAK